MVERDNRGMIEQLLNEALAEVRASVISFLAFPGLGVSQHTIVYGLIRKKI